LSVLAFLFYAFGITFEIYKASKIHTMKTKFNKVVKVVFLFLTMAAFSHSGKAASGEQGETGNASVLAFEISLNEGWNAFSFPANDTLDALLIVQSLIDQSKLIKVQDEAGNSIENWGIYGGWKNDIGNFFPGKTYRIKVNSGAVLRIQNGNAIGMDSPVNTEIKIKSLTASAATVNLNSLQTEVFPNPCQGRFTVRFSELPEAGSRIEVLDLSGRKVASHPVTGITEELDLYGQASGLYLVKSILGSSETIQKLILK
jgi:hypothetical protein